MLSFSDAVRVSPKRAAEVDICRVLLVAICGDRMLAQPIGPATARNIYLLRSASSGASGCAYGFTARYTLAARLQFVSRGFGRVEVFVPLSHGRGHALENCDIVMMLRLQTERMQGSFVPSIREYFHFFGLTYEKLAFAKDDALIMHPGPMNRGVEIDSELADDFGRSVIQEQVGWGSPCAWHAWTC